MRKNVLSITLGGLFAALFFVSSNILPPIYVIPGVPITFQVLVVVMMAGILGTRGGLITLITIYLMTLSGIPMMSGFAGGPAAFVKPTAGFILGWIFLVLAVGFYSDLLAHRLKSVPLKGAYLYGAGFIVAGVLGVLMDYFCGAAFLAVYNGTPKALLPTFVSTLTTFILFDALKVVAAFVFVTAISAILPRVAGRKPA